MANQISNGKNLLKQIKKEHRKLSTLKLRDAVLHNKIVDQTKKIMELTEKLSKSDLFLYKEQFDKMKKKL